MALGRRDVSPCKVRLTECCCSKKAIGEDKMVVGWEAPQRVLLLTLTDEVSPQCFPVMANKNQSNKTVTNTKYKTSNEIKFKYKMYN